MTHTGAKNDGNVILLSDGIARSPEQTIQRILAETKNHIPDPLLSAVAVWKLWPIFLEVSIFNPGWAYRDEAHLQSNASVVTYLLAQEHYKCARIIATELERHGLPPSPVFECSRYCCERMITDWKSCVYSSSRKAAYAGEWPHVIGQDRYLLPPLVQQAIQDSDALLERLLIRLELDPETIAEANALLERLQIRQETDPETIALLERLLTRLEPDPETDPPYLGISREQTEIPNADIPVDRQTRLLSKTEIGRFLGETGGSRNKRQRADLEIKSGDLSVIRKGAKFVCDINQFHSQYHEELRPDVNS